MNEIFEKGKRIFLNIKRGEKRKMKIKALEKFFDLELKVLHEAGEIFEVSEKRGAELTSKNNKAKRILCTVVSEGERIASIENEQGEEKAEVLKEKPKRKKGGKK